MVREDFHPEKVATESEEDLYLLLHLYNSKEVAHYLGPTLAETKVAHKSSFPLSAPFPPSPLCLPPTSHQRGLQKQKAAFSCTSHTAILPPSLHVKTSIIHSQCVGCGVGI